MKWKNKRALLMLTVSSALVFSGCAAQSTQTATETAGNTAGENKELPPYELTMAYLSSEQKDLKLIQDEINKITKAKINATVKLMPIDAGAYVQQTNLMLTANEKLDLMFTGSPYGYTNQISKGQLIPFEGLMEKYGQGIISTFEPAVMNSLKVNGHIYGVPSIRDWAADYGISMRKDIVDKYKIDVSKLKTLDDMESVFQIIKENEPSLTPLVSFDQISNSMMDKLDNGLGVLINDDMKNLKVVDWYETPQYAEMTKKMRKWFLAGYISKDAATTKATGYELVKAQKAFSFYTALKPGFDQDVVNRTGGIAMVSAHLSPVYSNSNRTINALVSIPKNSQNPERAMMFLNLLYTDKALINLLDNGIEGKHYVKLSDNIIDFPEGVNASNTGYFLENWKIGNSFNSYLWKGQDPDNWKKMDEFNKSSVKSTAFGFSFDSEGVKTELAAVTNVENQFKKGLDTGTLDPETQVPQFIAKLKAAGIDKIVAEKQKQLDAWAASNK